MERTSNNLIVFFVQPNGASKEVPAGVGMSLMEIAKNNDIAGIVADCGGSGVCGTCHCYLEEPWASAVPSPSRDELDLIDGLLDTRENSRLSCQVIMDENLSKAVIIIPENQF